MKKLIKFYALAMIIIMALCTLTACDVGEMDTLVDDLTDTVDYLTVGTDEILEKYADVIIGEFTVTEGTFTDDSKLPVKVKNKDTEKRSFTIQIEAVDKNGDRLDDDYIVVNDLNAGQSQNFELFTLVTSDEMDAYKTATFKVVEITMI